MFLFIRTLIIVIILISIFLLYKIDTKSKSKQILLIILWISLVHNLMIFPTLFIKNGFYTYIDQAAPFTILYGPLILFYALEGSGMTITRKTWLKHGLPILPFWLFFFVYIALPTRSAVLYHWYFGIVYGAIGCSLIGYSLYTLQKTKNQQTPKLPFIRYFGWYLLLSGIFMLFLTSVLITLEQTNAQQNYKEEGSGIIIALFMAIATYIIFNETQRLYHEQFHLKKKGPLKKELPISPILPTNNKTKTALPVGLKKLSSSKIIFDPNIDIETAAAHCDMSLKDFQKNIKTHYQKSFTAMLSEKRIDYACKLIRAKNFNGDYLHLYTSCGFKSRATFYRHFQKQKGCKPSEFKNQNQ